MCKVVKPHQNSCSWGRTCYYDIYYYVERRNTPNYTRLGIVWLKHRKTE